MRAKCWTSCAGHGIHVTHHKPGLLQSRTLRQATRHSKWTWRTPKRLMRKPQAAECVGPLSFRRSDRLCNRQSHRRSMNVYTRQEVRCTLVRIFKAQFRLKSRSGSKGTKTHAHVTASYRKKNFGSRTKGAKGRIKAAYKTSQNHCRFTRQAIMTTKKITSTNNVPQK